MPSIATPNIENSVWVYSKTMCWCRYWGHGYLVYGPYKMLVTVLAILVTNIDYLFTLASGTNIPKSSPTLSHQHHDVTVGNAYTVLIISINLVTNVKSPTISSLIKLQKWKFLKNILESDQKVKKKIKSKSVLDFLLN